MERPDQPRFDHFSRHFEEIDDELERFGSEHGWELKINPLRKPERDLHKITEATFMFGIWVEGNWLTLDRNTPLLHNVGITVVYEPEPILGFIRSVPFAEHQTFDCVKANLGQFLHRLLDFYQECVLPMRIEEDERIGPCYTVPEGWLVKSNKG